MLLLASLDLAFLHFHMKSVSRVDRGTCAHSNWVVQSLGFGKDIILTLKLGLVKLKVKPTENHCKCYSCLKSCELVSDTFTCSSYGEQKSEQAGC